MVEIKKEPEIRFAKFTDAWEKRKLEDEVEVIDGDRGKNYPSENEFQEKGHTLFLSATNVTKNGFVFHSNQYITEEKSNSLGNGKLKLNDIVLTSRGSLGHIAWYNKEIQRKVSFARINSGMLILRSVGDIEPSFITQVLKSPLGEKQIDFISFGSAQPQLTKKDVSRYTLFIPRNLDEQKVIGDFFCELDNLITLHQSKYDKTVNIKKAMLEKMFPKDGANVPEIRFTGFSGFWEQRRLEDITYFSGVKNSDNAPYESYSISNEKGFTPQDEHFEYGGTMREADKSMYYIVSPQSFAYNPARINVGSIGYQNLSKSVIVSSLYEVFKTTKECDDAFLWYWIKTEHFQKLIEQYQEGGVRLYFYYDKFCKGSLPLPCVDEQHKIGVLFAHLDHLITLHQQELEKLKNIKKACFEKMFV